MTDANSQTTSAQYDALGRVTALTLPGETSGETTQTAAYTVSCAATGAQPPCVEVQTTQRLTSTTVSTTDSFYDGYGRLVETSASGPAGQFVVRYTIYDPGSGQVGFQSQPYFVTSAGYSLPDTTVAGTTNAYDGLGRAYASTNALSQLTTTSYTVVCPTLP